ncbi:MAG: hypothetical protein ACK5PC_06205 [Cyclobacteriaceae bacterium]|jgi:hypothetical protein
MKFKYWKQLKTTSLGLALIGSTFILLFKGVELNEYLAGGLMLSGIILILSPDKYLTIVKEIITGVFTKKEN